MKNLLDKEDIICIKKALNKDLNDVNNMIDHSKNLTTKSIYGYFKNKKENIENLLKKLEEWEKEKW